MSLLEQINRVAGREIPTFLAEDFRAIVPGYYGKREFYEWLDRNCRVVDMRQFVAGEEKPSGPLMVLISDLRGGLLVQLWELKKTLWQTT